MDVLLFAADPFEYYLNNEPEFKWHSFFCFGVGRAAGSLQISN